MKYKNTKTGAIIDSPCKIYGGDWIEVEPPDEIKVVETEEQRTETEDVIDLSKMTVDELKRFATEVSIDLGKATKKDEIIKIIAESDEVTMDVE